MIGTDVAAAALGVLAGLGASVAFARLRASEAPAAGRGVQTTAAPTDDARAARVIDALPFAAFTVDAQRRVRVFNDAAAALFGVPPSRAVGRAIIEVVPSVELERMLTAACDGDTRTSDVAFGSGARERFFGVTVQPFEGGAMAIAADRTKYLAAERARRDFISDVSHELRTPLSAMKLMLETVLLSDDDAEARTLFLPQIAEEVERMIRLVQDLLELAKSDTGVVPLRRESFDLTDVATSTVNTFAHKADSLGVDLELDAPVAVPVDADRGRLIQVTVNLLDNALRHTPSGGRVRVEVLRQNGDAVLRVRDSGTGIPFLDLPRVFDRFYVVDRSRSREHGGTGLGLAIAKQLVEAHDGVLSAESVYGKGAVFTMRIPAATEDTEG